MPVSGQRDVVMAIKLFAHILRSGGAQASADPWSLDLRQWILRDFVVRRPDFAPWALQSAATGPAPLGSADAVIPEPLWADTQPCWRE
jgi:hypothetical protein